MEILRVSYYGGRLAAYVTKEKQTSPTTQRLQSIVLNNVRARRLEVSVPWLQEQEQSTWTPS